MIYEWQFMVNSFNRKWSNECKNKQKNGKGRVKGDREKGRWGDDRPRVFGRRKLAKLAMK